MSLALPAAAQLRAVETPEVRLVYVDPTETYLIPYAVRTFLNSYQFQRRLFKFDPQERVNVLLTDFSDSGNASATSVPRDSLRIQIAPLSFAFETIAGNDRLNIIMNHELVHVATMDQTAKPDRLFRRLFGGKVAPLAEEPESMLYFFATTPRVAAPRWFHEGSAVFVDTWMAGGLGRAQSGYDEMVFRSMVRDGARFYDPLGLVSEGTRIDFQVEVNSYLYGTRFITWLARRYSPEQVIDWVSRRDGSRAYYSSAFRHVFGVTLEQAWAAWVEDEQSFQQNNLELIRKFPTTSGQDLTTRALGSVSRAYYDPEAQKIYAGLNYPGALSHIGAISLSSGNIERLVDIKGPVIYTVTSLAYDPDTPALFYTTDNGAYRDLMRVDLTTHETRMLQKDLRAGDLVFNRTDRSIWGIRHLNGLCTLVRIPEPYKEWQRIVSWPYGTVVYDLDLSPDGARVVMSVGEPSGKQEVRVFRTSDLISGNMEPFARFDFGTAVPNNFVFSPNGRYLYGSSYYTGASNIFRYDLETQKLDAVTNAETGFFRPIPLEQADSLIVFRYTGNGFVPTRIDAKPLDDVSAITFLGERLAEERPIVKQWMVGPPSAVKFDDKIATRPYRLAGGLQSESMYPIVQGYKDTVGVGYRFNFSDPLQFNRATVTASVSPWEAVPAGERVHVSASYDRYNWRGRFDMNRADFYDLFGPTQIGRKGYAATVGHKNLLLFDEPRRLELDVEGRIAGKLDRLPEYQNIGVDVNRLASIQASLSFTNVRHSLGYVDDEAGTKWSAVAKTDEVDGAAFPSVYGTYDVGAALPLGHSSMWLRNAAGFSPRDAALPFANFYFGGFGNNWVDYRDEKRYREWYGLPGAELNEIAGANFIKSTAEWNLPPWRFQRVGTPGLYAAWLRPALFVGGLATNLSRPELRHVVTDTGGQIDVRIGALSVLELTASVGGAIAFEAGHAPRRELMFSLKVLR